jgi:tRNA G18 (ribose-2'-O)-methylase SpoU
VFRTCDALGFDLILVGYTPQPTLANMKLISKTAIGAEKTVSWKHFDHSQEVFDTFVDQIHIAIEISETSQNIYDFLSTSTQKYPQKNFMLWFGNEIHGVSELVCSQSNVSSCMCAVGYMFNLAFYTQNKIVL